MYNLIFALLLITSNPILSRAYELGTVEGSARVQLASRSFSMEKRYDNESTNAVFRDNILLTLHYMNGNVTSKEGVVWEKIQQPARFEFTLKPNEGFAFHDQISAEFEGKIVKTTNAHFNFQDGFKTSGLLYGDGVCHLASFIHMVALEAGLTSISEVNHDFAKINEVSREFGVSIKYVPGEFANSSRQNLYIINNKLEPVTFVFDYDGVNLTVAVEQ